MILTKAEAINLILVFFDGVCWADFQYDMPELDLFIKEGLALLDVEDERKIIPSERGREILNANLEEIKTDYISFMRKQGMDCVATKVEEWFMETYGLLDKGTGEDIALFVARNLNRPDYISMPPFRERKNDKYIIQECF